VFDRIESGNNLEATLGRYADEDAAEIREIVAGHAIR
jgi:hypothetical protein